MNSTLASYVALTPDEQVQIVKKVDDLYRQARTEAKKLATFIFNQVYDETDDPFEAMQAYNTVMENMTGRK